MKHPKNYNQRPKRRKAADNPYTLYTTGIDSASPCYYLSFRDSSGEEQHLEIDHTLFAVFDEFEREDLSYLNEVDRHYEHSQQTEASLARRALYIPESVEALVSRKMTAEALYKAMDKLPEKQRRRVTLYYFEGLTYAQIAALEDCALQVVAKSVKAAEKNLRKFMTEG